MCDPATGLITHPATNVDDNDPCTADGCNSITGVFHNPICPINYTCCIEVITQTAPNILEFDVIIEWTGTNTQKLTLFQGGINFNYTGMSNGGTITGAFKSGSADLSLPAVQQNLNWNVNASSKQIRLFAAIASVGSATAIPSPPGFRLGTFVITNTVPFTSLSTPNFVWSFLTGTGTTSKTQVSVYVNGASTGTDVTIPPNHCVDGNPALNPPCPSADAGGTYSSCGDVHLNGSIAFATTGTWSSSGNGTFDPSNTTLNATYHPSVTDLISGNVILTLTTDTGGFGCNPASTNTTATFTSTNDNDACTTDGCDQSTSLATHTPVNTADGDFCTTDACDTATGVTHTAVNVDDNDACTTDACNTGTGAITHTPVNIDDNNQCTLDACNSTNGNITHTSIPCGVTLNSNILLEGFYIGGGFMTNCLFTTGISPDPLDADSIFISAMNSTSPYAEVDRQPGILKTNGDVTVTFGPAVVANNAYYLKVNHRNSVEIWSAAPVILTSITSYSFSSATSQAFASNEAITFDALYAAIYAGDINQDGAVDGSDFLELDPSIQNGDGGYFVGDLNGDGSIDGSDFLVLDPNIQGGIGANFPTP